MNQQKEGMEEENWHLITGPNGMCACGDEKGTCGKQLRSKISSTLAQRDEEYAEIFKWLLGEKGDFPDLSQKPHYSFRNILGCLVCLGE